jgi:flagellar protein FlgJ
MISTLDTNSLVLEGKGLSELKLAAKQDPQSIKVVAKQFEAMFLNILTKSMRGASDGKSLFDNNETRLYTEMLDQQFSQKIAAGKGLGLADMLVQQLTRNQASPPPSEPGAPLLIKKEYLPQAFTQGLPGSAPTPLPIMPIDEAAKIFNVIAPQALPIAPVPTSEKSVLTPKQFVSQISSHAAAAARELGVPAQGILAQAALESGWGKREIKQADGSSSFNLFGIKANAQWTGKVAEVTSTEYVNGVPQQRVARFRAYGSYEEAFKDYASLLKSSPRYQAVLNTNSASQFAQGLQRAGYATDPRYASKLASIAGGSLLRSVA